CAAWDDSLSSYFC
nr:immunoglobulin light chain junction region [Macaca mulatta]MPN85551.1 immunoglobulin light chain junction region [Macaca mulatta]MPN86172.1 immunoglobulin light chain junction region [Macaca mulatta]